MSYFLHRTDIMNRIIELYWQEGTPMFGGEIPCVYLGDLAQVISGSTPPTWDDVEGDADQYEMYIADLRARVRGRKGASHD